MYKSKKAVKLTEDEQKALAKYKKKGKPKQILRAKILLALDESSGQEVLIANVVKALKVSKQTINIVKQAYLKGGLDSVLIRKNAGKNPYQRKVTGDVEANIITIACGETPDGHSQWTLRQIADRIVELKIVDKISHVTIYNVLKKRNLLRT
jgi:transposase